MGLISIKGLKIHAYHGLFEQERKVGNDFEVNVTLDVPSADDAMASDSIDDTINYAHIVEIIKREMSVRSNLIEAVVGRIKTGIVEEYPIQVVGGEIEVCKLSPPLKAQLDSVSYTYRW